MIKVHDRKDLSDAKDSSSFAEFEISDEDYNRIKPPVVVPPPPGQPGTDVGDTKVGNPNPSTEPVTEYIGEPVARLRQILLINGGNTVTVDTVNKVMSLNKYLWGDPYALERMLIPFFPSKKEWVQQCVAQYIHGVELPSDYQGNYYQYGDQNRIGRYPSYGYGYPNQPGGPNYNQPVTDPTIEALRAEIKQLREERQAEQRRQEQQVLLDRIAKLESGGFRDPVLARLESIEKQISGGGMPTTMTIYDEKGHPMVLPYDRSFQDAMTRKAEAETKLQEFNQIIALTGNRGGVDEATKAQMKRLEEETATANKRVEELIKAMTDQRIAQLEAGVKEAKDRAKAAEEAVANGTGESKGVLDFASEAAQDIRAGAAEAAREIKEGVTESIDKLSQIITNRPTTTAPAVQRTPEEIADIMDAENTFLGSIGEK
jgi:hypothetical protein